MNDELWMKKIKERLDDYSEPLPTSGWERLEKDLPVSPPVSSGMKKQISFRRWAMVAAAALLVAVSTISVWLMQSPVADEVRKTAIPALAVTPDALPEQSEPALQTEYVEPVMRRTWKHGKSRPMVVAQQLEKAEEGPKQVVMEYPAKEENTSEVVKTEEPANTQKTTQAEVKQERVVRRPSGKDKLHVPVDKKATSKRNGWSVGLSVGNTGSLALLDGDNVKDLLQDPLPGGSLSGGKLDLSATANGILTIPEGQELYFKDGMPYLRSKAGQITDIYHKQPISFGVSVRKGLSKGFSVETGLVYTLLSSDVRLSGNTEEVSQKLHYIGIPLRANWNFIDKPRFIMYVSGGGMVEKCVYGKLGSKDETVKPVQLSVLGAVGAQYNISKRVGVYVEPGVSYFFDDGSSVQTIRKENPCNFTLQGGIRLTY